MTLGAALWLPRTALAPGVALIWLLSTVARSYVDGTAIVTARNVLELAGLGAIGAAAYQTRVRLERLEEVAADVVDPETGVQSDRFLKKAIEEEIARSRRFKREFSLMLVGVDRRRLRFDYRDEKEWRTAFQATAMLLRSTRAYIDRVFRFGDRSFALVLPETGPSEVSGMIRRLNRLARASEPAEGEPGGPLPTNIGVTFYPQAATAADDLIRRAEVALRVAEKTPSRVKYDGAEAPDLPDPESLRRPSAGPLPGLNQDLALSSLGGIEAEDASHWPVPIGEASLEAEAAETDTPNSQLGDAVTDLLQHLDDTLSLIQELKSA
jgi:diguanylate cyclase (GGDEF)-like protein